MIAKGSTEISKVCLGSDELSKVCLGDDVIWEAEQRMRYVQYIEANGTQYIDTLLTPTSASEITVDGDFRAKDQTSCFFSACTSWNWSQYTFFLSDNRMYWAVKSTALNMSLQRYVYKIVGATLYMDNVQKQTASWNNAFVNTTFKIFKHGNTASERSSQGKLYGSTFKDNGVLLQNLVPVAIGNVGYMLDTISGDLFGDANGGSFAAGPDL